MKQKLKRYSFYLNIFLVCLLAFIVIKENYIFKLKQKLFPDASLEFYQNRPAYKEQLSKYDIYNKQATVAMLGTSLTQDIDWNELLNRGDVINRGYGGDIIKVMASRLPYIIKVHPKICFIEAGINDIDMNIPIRESMQHLTLLIDSLKQHSIVTVLNTVTHVTNTAYKHANRNNRIASFNLALVQLAKEKNIDIINNNLIISPNGFLKPEYAKYDGLHYLPSAYLIWKENIEKILTKNDL